nr:hypothetical protein [Tanacetum cinerariifolium]
MTSLADKAIVSGADNRPPMLEKDMYDLWKSRMELYMLNRQHRRMILESIESGPLLWPSIEEKGVTRLKNYSELSPTEAIQADCDVKATNIILQGLPSEVYALVSNHKVAKELWERIQMLMQGTSLTKQEMECKLYDEFDKFAYRKGESLRDYYLRFSLLLNDMNIYNMKLEQFQVNTKFLNTLPLEWSKFVTDSDDPIDAINHMMSFLTSVVTSRYPSTNNQLRTSSNPRQQATINNRRVTIQPIQGSQNSMTDGSSRPYTSGSNGTSWKQKVIVCYNCKGECHMSKQCTKPKKRRDEQWFKDKIALMANLSHYGSDNLAESETKITSDSNIISYSQYMNESQYITIWNSSSHTLQDDLILSVIEQLKTQVVNCIKINQDNKNVNEILTAVLERYKNQERILKEQNNVDNASVSYEQSLKIEKLKHILSKHLKEKESIEQKQLKPKLYDGSVIEKSDAIVIHDSEETLMLVEESRSKMIQKQNEPIMSEKKSRYSVQPEEPNLSVSTAIVEVLKELPKVSMVNSSLKKLKFHLASFDMDTVIVKLKDRLKSLSGNVQDGKIKRELEEIETLNIELDHRVTKLVAENEHLKQTYKQLYDLIKSFRVRSKEQYVAPLAPKLHNNRTAHTDYLRYTQKETATLREIVKSERLLNPLNTSLDYAYTKAISSVTNSKLNVNADLKCATCNGCLFSDNHDSCVLAYINSVNASLKSKSVKKPINRKIWQPTGKLFTTIGHIWKPTGRTFILVGNVCPLTRIATTAIVPLREPIPIVVQIVLWYLDSSCSKHMIRDRSQLINFVQNFLGTVKFGNDHVANIMGYGDYKIGNVTISRVYFVEGLWHNLFSMGQFCNSDMEVAFCQHTCFIRSLDGVDLLTGSRGNNLYTLSLQDMMASSPISRQGLVRGLPKLKFKKTTSVWHVQWTLREYYEEVGISHETSVACSPQQNGIVERRNCTLIEAARTMLIYAQAPLFLWAEAVATACYTQNRSIIRLHYGKTPYELLHNKLPDLSFPHVFGALCYPTNDNFDELTAMASEQSSSGLALNKMTPVTISLGLVHKSSSSTPYVQPSRNDWDLLFQPMFDELLNPSPTVDHQALEVIALIDDVIPPVQDDSTGSPSSTTVDQDAPFASKSHTTAETKSTVIPQDVCNTPKLGRSGILGPGRVTS